jgi:hypothetical protein
MEKIVLVTGDRHNPQAHHIKISNTTRIGRGFGCDVILSDPHIEPEQLVFHYANDRYSVEVLPGTNPVFRNGLPISPGSYPFVSGEEWVFGKTHLTAFSENHPIEVADKILLKEFNGSMLAQIAIFILGITALVGWLEMLGWISHYQPPEWQKDMAEWLMYSGYTWFVILWSSVMGVIGRFTSGRGQFNIHLITAVLFVIASTCFETVADYAIYAFRLPTAWNMVRDLGSALILTGFLIVCFSHTLNIRGMKYMALGMGICWFAINYLGEMAAQKPLQPSFNASVKPPFAVILKPGSVEDFMLEVNDTFTEVQKPE